MTENKRKMVMTPKPSKEVDVDALISAAGGGAPKSAKKAARPSAPRVAAAPKREVVTAPWDEPENEPRRPINFLLSQRHRQMLHFLKSETGLPTQKRLEKLALEAIEDEAIALWKVKHGK